MASLSNTKIKDTYQSLVKFSDNGNITIGAKRLTDGFGNNSPLYVSTTQIGIGITPQSGYGLHVSSDVKIGSNLEVSGNLTVNGTLTYLNVADLEVDDPLIQLAVNNAANILDIGLFGKYASSGTKYKGLFNDASDDKFKLFTGLTVKPLTTVNTSATGYTVATLVANLEGNVTGNVTGGTISGTTGSFSSRIYIGGGSDSGSQLNLWADSDGNTFLAGYTFAIYTGNNNSRTQSFKIDHLKAATFAGNVTATQYNVSNTSGYLVRENTGSGYGLFKSSTTNIGIASNGNVALNFDSSGNATFAGNVSAQGGTFTQAGGGVKILNNGTAGHNANLFFGKSGGTDGYSIGQGVTANDGVFRIYNNGTASVPLAIADNNNSTFTGNLTAPNVIYGSNSSGTQEGTVNDWDAPTKTGFYSSSNASNRWTGQANWSSILHFKLYDDNNLYSSQIGFNTYNDGLWTRTNNNGTWTSWYKIWTDNVHPTTLAGYGITDGVTIDTAQTITGVKTFSNSIIGNLTGNVTGNVTGNAYLNTIAYQGGEGTELDNSAFNVDGIGTTFRWIESNSGATGSTWKKIADIVITNTITPNGVQMEAKVYQPNTNSGVTAGLNTVYYSIAFRGRIDDSSTHNDAIVYGQDANLLRVYKTADYTFELQARSNDDNRDLVVECNITSKKGGKVTPTTTYTYGTATGGTAYTASGNALNKTKFAGNVEFEGAIFDSAEVEDLRVNELLYFGSGATSGYGPHISHSDSGVGTGKGMTITVDSDLQVWGVTGNAGEQNQGLYVAGGVVKLYDMNGVVLETVLGGVDLTGTLEVSGTITGDVTGDLTGNADTSTKIASITNSNIVQLTTTQTLTNKTLTSPTITGTGAIAGVFTGDLTGNVTGDVTGDLTGDVTGNLTGNVTGLASLNTPLNDIRSLGIQYFTNGTDPNITTAEVMAEIESDGGFDSYSSVFKTAWSYAGNYNLTDAGRFTETAGSSWITWTDNASDTTRGNITALAIAPTTGGSSGKVFIYNDQGTSYNAGWREVWTNTSDGAGSGLDADLLDGQQGAYYAPATGGSYVAKAGDTMTGNLKLNDDVLLEIGNGTGGDAWIYHNGTDTLFRNATGDLYIDQLADDKNISFRSDDGSGGTVEYFRVDGGDSRVIFGRSIQMADNVSIYFGNAVADDGFIKWDSTANQLFINGNAKFLEDLYVTGNQYFNGSFIEGEGKEMFRYSDAWLRINEDSDFTSGIYCGTGILRTDGQFEVGSGGNKFQVTSAGVVTALGNISAPTFNSLAINTTGVNNLVNQIVRTNVNGYAMFGWINSTSGPTTSTITRITASNDTYLRYVTPATFRSQIITGHYLPLSGGVVTGSSDFTASQYPLDVTGAGSVVGSTAVGLGVYAPNNTTGAIMNFHRSGAYAVNFGLDTDNILRIGGWSATSEKWYLDMNGVNMVPGSFRAPLFYDSDNTAYYGNFADITIGKYFGRAASNEGFQLGSYNNIGSNGTHSNPIYTIGSSYIPALTTLGNMYGIGYTNTSSSFIGLTGASSWGMYVAADGNARIFLSGANGGISTAGVIYASQYYDYGNTAYYLDPASTSNINALSTAGNIESGGRIRLAGGTDSGSQLNLWADASGYCYIAGYNLRFMTGGNNARVQRYTMDHTGIFTANASVRSPIFYDTNNTAYYVDPASTSFVNTFRSQALGANNSGSQSNQNGLSLYGSYSGGLPTYGMLFSGVSVNGSFGGVTGDWATYFTMNGSTGRGWVFKNVSGSPVASITNLGWAQFAASVRAPIFYDSNNTGYYIHPDSTSVMNQINAGSGNNPAFVCAANSSYGAGTELYIGGWSAGTTVSRVRNSNGNLHIDSKQGHHMYLQSYPTGNVNVGNGGGYLLAYNSMRSPIFYDSNDTVYYLNPASDSNLVNIGLKGRISFPASGLANHARGSQSYAIYQESGAWTSPFPDLNIGFHTGISMGAYAGYNGMRFYNNSDMATQVMSINNGSDGLGANQVYVNDALQAGSSLRAPIFYDSNNTTYLADLSNTSTSINAAGTGIFGGDVVAYSDKKLKTNIKTLDGSKVLKMRGVSFDRIDTGNASSGVIAQEIQEIAPELVNDKNGTLAVAYGNLTGYLIEAIKKQQKQIDELTNIINKLK